MSNKVTLVILYPKQSDSTFDMKYYLASHIPLVQDRWSSLGLHNWTVLQFEGDAPYNVQASFEFDTMAGFEKASKDTKVFDDILKFSNKSPTMLVGKVAGAQG
jgi:uncharacterized protein (TIGR02118 family)